MKDIIITSLCLLVPACPAILILIHSLIPSVAAEVLIAGLAAVYINAIAIALVIAIRQDQKLQN